MWFATALGDTQLRDVLDDRKKEAETEAS